MTYVCSLFSEGRFVSYQRFFVVEMKLRLDFSNLRSEVPWCVFSSFLMFVLDLPSRKQFFKIKPAEEIGLRRFTGGLLFFDRFYSPLPSDTSSLGKACLKLKTKAISARRDNILQRIPCLSCDNKKSDEAQSSVKTESPSRLYPPWRLKTSSCP